MCRYNKALELKISVFGAQHEAVAGTYRNMGVAKAERGDQQAALVWYARAMDVFVHVLGEDSESGVN